MIAMKITYVWTWDLNYITNKRSYRFNKANNFTVDVQNYEDIYTMIKDSRHGTSLKLDKDPILKKVRKYTTPGIISMSTNSNKTDSSLMVITTKTASGKDKVQEVKDLDKIIDEVIVEWDPKEIAKTIKDTKKKLNKSKPKKK